MAVKGKGMIVVKAPAKKVNAAKPASIKKSATKAGEKVAKVASTSKAGLKTAPKPTVKPAAPKPIVKPAANPASQKKALPTAAKKSPAVNAKGVAQKSPAANAKGAAQKSSKPTISRQPKSEPQKAPAKKVATKGQVATKNQAGHNVPKAKAPTTKRHIVVSYKKLQPELLKQLKEKYPTGWDDYVIKINKNPAEFFYAVMLETPDTSYLIKVDVKVDARPKDDEDILDSVIGSVVDSSDDSITSTDDTEEEDLLADEDNTNL
jgi:hypothetical protein